MKFVLAYLSFCLIYCAFAQEQEDTTYLSSVYLDEVVIFNKKLPGKKLGYLNKENFTFGLYKDYEIGAFIENTENLNNIADLHLKISNELTDEFDIEINFYDFDEEPNELLRSVDARVKPSNKNKLIISGTVDIKFPKKGIFVSIKIKSNLHLEDNRRFKVYLSQKYESKSTFIRGSSYGTQWTEISKLNLRKGKAVNVCFGIRAY